MNRRAQAMNELNALDYICIVATILSVLYMSLRQDRIKHLKENAEHADQAFLEMFKGKNDEISTLEIKVSELTKVAANRLDVIADRDAKHDELVAEYRKVQAENESLSLRFNAASQKIAQLNTSKRAVAKAPAKAKAKPKLVGKAKKVATTEAKKPKQPN
jgi:hypothetical protein